MLRDLVARASEEEINETRKQLMQEVYDLLSVTLELRQKHSLTSEYRDKDSGIPPSLEFDTTKLLRTLVG